MGLIYKLPTAGNVSLSELGSIGFVYGEGLRGPYLMEPATGLPMLVPLTPPWTLTYGLDFPASDAGVLGLVVSGRLGMPFEMPTVFSLR